MAISDEIARLQQAKADLKTAIEGKGVTVSSSAKLEDYPALVDSIQAGGGGGCSYTEIFVNEDDDEIIDILSYQQSGQNSVIFVSNYNYERFYVTIKRGDTTILARTRCHNALILIRGYVFAYSINATEGRV